MKQPAKTRIADIKKLQEIMHYHGIQDFQQLLRATYFNASDEMENLDMEVSEQYRELANSIEGE